MKLHEIILAMSLEKSVNCKEIRKYKRSLITYFKSKYKTEDLLLVVISVTNFNYYCLILSEKEFKKRKYQNHQFIETQVFIYNK